MLHVENLTKVYSRDDKAGGIRNLGFHVAAGEFYTLLGPSGCGKTTTLRSVAGLEEPSSGRMTLGGEVIFDAEKRVFVPADQRRLGMVFQSYAVWPHMTVFDNTAFPLRMSKGRRWSRADIQQRVTQTLETLGLGAYAARSAAQLSGGQQQRLSLARALVAEPRLLLLDEPLSNLDALLREQMRSELRRLQKDVGVTAIYVTHDQSEALGLSDRIAVMRNGGIEQVGTPHEIYHRPGSVFVATFVGRSNVLRGRLIDIDTASGHARIATALGPVLCQGPMAGASAAAGGQPGAAMIRPEHVVVTPAAGAHEPAANRFRGRLAHVTFLGEITEYTIKLGDAEIIARIVGGMGGLSGDVDVVLTPDRTLAFAGDVEPSHPSRPA